MQNVERSLRAAYEAYFRDIVAEFRADVAKKGLAKAPKRISHSDLAFLKRGALWNALIPDCARLVEVGATHTKYLHPRKGWRRVSNARLGLAGPIFR